MGNSTFIYLWVSIMLLCAGCNKDDDGQAVGTLTYNGKTISVTIGNIGKDKNGNISIELHGLTDNIMVINNGKMSPHVSMDIVVDNTTLKASSWEIQPSCNVYTFSTKTNPEKIIVYVVNGNSSVTFDGKGKRVIDGNDNDDGSGNDNDNDDGSGNNNGGNTSKITATNVINSSTQIATVKAIVYWENNDDDYGSDVIAQTQYKNKGFTLELPSTLSAKYLFLVYEDAPQGISISNQEAKGRLLEDIEGYDKDENEIGYFYLVEENDDSEHYTSWLYVDRDVTIKGEYKKINDYYDEEYLEKYDLQLKKGWNVVYESYMESYNNSTKRDVYTGSLTSKKPSGVNYSWNFYDGYGSAKSAIKSGENTKSVFSTLKENRKSRTRK